MMRDFAEGQRQALAAIDAEIKKMTSAMEAPGVRGDLQQMTDEERSQARERFMQMRTDRDRSIAVIEEQLAKLKGARSLTAEHEESLTQLRTLSEQAKRENATGTAAAIDKMIADRDKAFNDRLSKLGLERSTGRGMGGERMGRPRGTEGTGEGTNGGLRRPGREEGGTEDLGRTRGAGAGTDAGTGAGQN
jgi:hypothetical protein